MADDERKSPPTEDNAVDWPPPDYRAFVQTQIASKMLLRLGSITIATAVLVVVAIVGYVEVFEQRITDRIVREAADAAADELEQEISGIVASALLDQADLVGETVDQAQIQFRALIPGLVQSPEFFEPATDAVFAELSNTGGSQRLILDEAAEHLFEDESDPATRALSLRIFMLFHPGVSEVQNIPPIQQTFNDLLQDDESSARPLPPQLVDAMLEHYPNNASPANIEVCSEFEADCDRWHLQMLEFVLDYAGSDRMTELSEANLRTFFRRLPPPLADHAMDWAADNASAPLVPVMMAALVAAENDATLEEVVDRLSVFVDDGDQTLQRRSIEAFAGTNPDAALPRDVRAQALRRVWQSFGAIPLEEVFSSDALRRQRELGTQLFGESDVGDLEDFLMSNLAAESPDFVGSPELSRLFANRESVRQAALVENQRRIVVIALLRGDFSDQQTGGLEEWALVFEPAIGERLTEPALNALAMRLSRDAATERDVSVLADQILTASLDDAQTRVHEEALAVALGLASPAGFEAAVADYQNAIWARSGRPEEASSASIAILQRQLEAKGNPLDWFDTSLQATPEGTAFGDHLLSSFADVHGAPAPDDSGVHPLQRALVSIEGMRETYHGDLTPLRTTLLRRLAALAGRNRWQAAQIAEDSGVLAALVNQTIQPNPQYATLTTEYNWWNRPLPDTSPVVTLQSTRAQFDVPRHEPNDGFWFLLRVADTSIFETSGAAEGRIVIFNSERNRIVDRSEMREPVLLEEGTYAVHLRGLPQGPHSIRVEPSDLLFPTTMTAPIPLDHGEYVFSAGSNEGELWLALDLQAGQSIEIGTEEIPADHPLVNDHGSNPPDTVIDLYNGDGSVLLARDDDGGRGTLSMLQFTAEAAGTHLVRIHRYFDRPLHRDANFSLMISGDPQ